MSNQKGKEMKEHRKRELFENVMLAVIYILFMTAIISSFAWTVDAMAQEQKLGATLRDRLEQRLQSVRPVQPAREGVGLEVPQPGYEVIIQRQDGTRETRRATRGEILQLIREPDVKQVDENFFFEPNITTRTPVLEFPEVWGNGGRGQGKMVVVMDAGVDGAHGFLPGLTLEACFSHDSRSIDPLCPNGLPEQIGPGSAPNCPLSLPGCWHGTHVAGIAVADFNQYTGAAPDANLGSIQIFSHLRSVNRLVGVRSDFLDAITYLDSLPNPEDIASVVMSFSSGTEYLEPCDGVFTLEQPVIESLVAKGIALVSSAGNNGNDGLAWPQCIPGIISVGSVSDTDVLSVFSNYATYLDVVAPGENILSSYPGNQGAVSSGTSQATPFVGGYFAAIRSLDPNATTEQALTVLKSTGLQVSTPAGNVGRLRADLAGRAFVGNDTDGDGVHDGGDNCTTFVNGWDAPDAGGNWQYDTDKDGYGNICDGDLNNDGLVDDTDYDLYRLAHRSVEGDPEYNPDADFNGDKAVNTLDLWIFADLHGLPPGPSGFAP